MAYKLVPRPLHTKILAIEFARNEPGPGPLNEGPVYRVDATVNGAPFSFEVLLVKSGGFGIFNRPSAFGTLKYPDGAVHSVVRRFSEGETLVFPVDLGDIGKV